MNINTYTRMLKTDESNIILSQFKISPNFQNYSTSTTTFIINSPMAYSSYQFINNMFSNIINTIIHEFISSSSNHNFIIHHFSQKYNIFIHMIFDTWIQYQQHLIIQFTCTNISSTIRHEFIHQISHKHLFSKSLN